jgi:hypothetical protein
LEQDGLLGKDDICGVNGTHRRPSMPGKFAQVLYFLCHDLLRRDFAIISKEMVKKNTHVGSIVYGGGVEYCSEVEWISDLYNLSNVSLLSCLTDLKSGDIFCCLKNLSTGDTIVGSEDFGESLNGHGETGNGPDADVLEHFPTTEKKGSLSYADAARGTKRYVSFLE